MKARILYLLLFLLLVMGFGSSWPTRQVYWPLVVRSYPSPELVMPTPPPPIPLATLINDWREEEGLERLWPEVRLHRAASLMADQVIRYNCDDYVIEFLAGWALATVGYWDRVSWGMILCGEYDAWAVWRWMEEHGGPRHPEYIDLGIQHRAGLDFRRRGGRRVTDVWVVLAAREEWP